MPKGVTYKSSGVDISAADKLIDFLKTRNKSIGGFSGLVPFNGKGMKKPMLVASTDGVGTKLLLAKHLKDFSTIGIDLVAMVVNDLITCGAKPLFFLDYYATGKLKLSEAKQVLEGILAGCEIAGCPLIGGETAELPGLYQDGDFDLAGFGVGIVDGAKAIDGRGIRAGDVVYGFESNGLHSNGYSLARRALLDVGRLPLNKRIAESKVTLGKALLEPTRIYTRLVAELMKSGAVTGLAHITGGGIPGNLNRVLPAKADAEIHLGSWPVHPLFQLIQNTGPVVPDEMYRTFNMGLGLMGVGSPGSEKQVRQAAAKAGEKVHVVGRIVKGKGAVRLIGGA